MLARRRAGKRSGQVASSAARLQRARRALSRLFRDRRLCGAVALAGGCPYIRSWRSFLFGRGSTADQHSHCWRHSRARRRADGKPGACGAGLSLPASSRTRPSSLLDHQTRLFLLDRQTLPFFLDHRRTQSTRWTIVALASPSGPIVVRRKSGKCTPSAITFTTPSRCRGPPRTSPTSDWRIIPKASLADSWGIAFARSF